MQQTLLKGMDAYVDKPAPKKRKKATAIEKASPKYLTTRATNFSPAAMISRRGGRFKAVGGMGTRVSYGWVHNDEFNEFLSDIRTRMREFGQMILDVGIISGSINQFQGTIGRAVWQWEPADDTDLAQKVAEFYNDAFTKDCDQPFSEINKQMAMSKFYGFSFHEFEFKRRPDGMITIANIFQRPQKTIERFDVDHQGRFYGVIQRDVNSWNWTYLPKEQIIYILDSDKTDSPEGLGLLREVWLDAKLYTYLKQLRTAAAEDDMRGIVKAKFPQAAINQAIEDASPEPGTHPTEPQMSFRDYVMNQIQEQMNLVDDAIGNSNIKNDPKERVGFPIPSDPYETVDGTSGSTKQVNIPMWDIELLEGPAKGQEELLEMMQDVRMDIALALGTSALLVGTNETGTYSTILEKSDQFTTLVDNQLAKHAEVLRRGVMRTLALVNNIPDELIPTPKVERAKTIDPLQTAQVFQALSNAGVPLMVDDPAVNYIRSLVGAPMIPQDVIDQILEDKAEMKEAMKGDGE